MRTRLLVAVVAAVAGALILVTVGFNVLLARSLSHDANAVLRTRAATEAASVDVVNDKLVSPDAPDSGGLESQAWVLRGSATLERPRVSAALEAAARRAAASPGRIVDVASQHARLFAMTASDYPDVVVVAGVSLTPYEQTRRVALVATLLLAGLVLLVVALAARWMLSAALRPVATMTADAESWSENDLDRRFAAGEPYDEISQLSATLDGLLDRLAASLRREQRFSAELSHEMRTPLARLQAEAELALRRERSSGDYRAALETILRNARQMSTAVETLVVAAQQESGLGRGRSRADLVLEEVGDTCAGIAADRGVELTIEPPAASLSVGVDADVVVRMLQPVVENACHLARSRVILAARREPASVVFTIDDDGPGVLPEERELIFDPGVRGSASEAGSRPGAGLGLALSRRLARAAGGDVDVLPAADGGHFTVRLPFG